MSYATYELLKRDWVLKNPNATHEEYQKAMREISKKAGV